MTLVCPHCGKATTAAKDWKTNPFRPFCSERCKMMDLGDWAAEKYRVESETQTPDSSATDPSKTNPDED